VEQWIFMPPVHFSMRTVQRGTIIMFIAGGIVAGAFIVPPPMPGIPVMPIPVRSIIIGPVIVVLLDRSRGRDAGAPSARSPALIMPTSCPLATRTQQKHRNSIISKIMILIAFVVFSRKKFLPNGNNPDNLCRD
jgi:hypothetical protein